MVSARLYCIAWAVTRPRHVNVDLLVAQAAQAAQAAQHKVHRESD
ncbi:hypothetical protein O2W18_14015 [Modestobacter sp. VKM Ac-2983]|nr:hypothetical protein [Modestobacter sp. VKM Ac-2983]MCZ2806227.1 hypothetical protein [Modestobacter sp. VKM Ac-2983]